MLRGIKYEVDQFVDVLSGAMLPYPTKAGNKFVQLAMRPIQLYEAVFPKQSLPNVLKAMNYTNNRKDIRLQLAALRKILGAKKLPKLDLKDVVPVQHNASPLCACYPIGIREDKQVWGKGHDCEGGEQL